MANIEVKVYPAPQEKNNNLGAGSVCIENALVVKFSIWKNDKFSDGFAISFPFKKGPDGKIYNDAYFLDKELERSVYETVKPQIAHLLGGSVSAPAQQVANGGYQSAPTQITSAPKDDNKIPW